MRVRIRVRIRGLEAGAGLELELGLGVGMGVGVGAMVGYRAGYRVRVMDLPLGAVRLLRQPRLVTVSSTHVVPGSSRAVADRRGEQQRPPPRPRHSKYQTATPGTAKSRIWRSCRAQQRTKNAATVS